MCLKEKGTAIGDWVVFLAIKLNTHICGLEQPNTPILQYSGTPGSCVSRLLGGHKTMCHGLQPRWKWNIMNNRGFTLFELVVTIILIGIIGVLSSLFLYNGIKGFMTSKLASEGALTGQIAIDRIALELRSIETIDSFDDTGGNVVMNYKSNSLPGARELKYDPTNRRILIGVGTKEYLLLDQVPTFSLNIHRSNLDNKAGDEVAGFEVSFKIQDIGKPFATRIYPRTLLSAPAP